LGVASMFVIETKDLVKKFRSITAVDHVDLRIAKGECFGLLGPNGAGKTTVIRMITAASPPTSGEIHVLGLDLRAFARESKARMGVVPQLDNLDPDLSVLQNLLTFARYFNIAASEAGRRAGEVLKLFELQSRSKSDIRELSGGMKRRLLIARALLNNPEILVLDEPTVGLDPQAKYLVWRKLTELKEKGVTQLLCTQNMEEAAVLCDRVAIMHQGKVMAVDAPAQLVSKYVGDQLVELSTSPGEGEKLGSELKQAGMDFEQSGNTLYIFHLRDIVELRAVLPELNNWKIRPATLEDVFFRISGRTLSE
jgi:lipooligosaccharide transport system ATP-binding protein